MLSFCKKTQNTIYYKAVSQIPEKIWQDLGCAKNLYFSQGYLNALEKNNLNITFYYIVLLNDYDKAIAFTSIQIIDFQVHKIQEEAKSFLDVFKKIIFPKEKSIKILVSGNTFVSGEHGIFIAKNQNKKTALKELTKAIVTLSNTDENLSKNISIFMLKDFEKESLKITDELKELNYFAFKVEPNMQFNIAKNWRNFDDYLADLKTKFRVKAKKALQLSKDLKTKEVNLENIAEQLAKMKSLYEKVAQKAAFNLEDFNLETYKTLKENLGENYILKTYYLNDKMVGFLSGIINENALDAHFVGIDYSLNKEYAIYQKMLYDYIKIGIENKLKTINFGRTASEIKSSIGAIPQELTIYIRHKKTLKNKILQLFLQRIAPTAFHQKYPFKSNENENDK